jgi:hypothetical protein
VSDEIEEFERKFLRKGEEEEHEEGDEEKKPQSSEHAQHTSTISASSPPHNRLTQTLKDKSQLGATIPASTLRIKRNPEV